MQVARTTWVSSAALLMCLAAAGCDHPAILTRTTAASAIEATAELQHKTKLRFLIGQAEGVVEGVCHNFTFRPESKPLIEQYLKAGQLKFFPYGSQSPPFDLDYGYSNDLALDADGLLADNIQPCVTKKVTSETGEYELTIGNPIVEVNGILKSGNDAHVDFTWHFDSLSKIGKSLGFIQGLRESEKNESHFSEVERSKAPFWNGTAEMARYDDGWRVVSINMPWGYSFSQRWPDPDFNWGTSDEDQNIGSNR